jgi:nucleoside-diphosphate-sugar epimerase
MRSFDVILIGGNGFFASHLIPLFKESRLNWLVLGRTKPANVPNEQFRKLDLLNPKSSSQEAISAKTLVFNSTLKGRFPTDSPSWRQQGLVSAPDFFELESSFNLHFDRLLTIGSSEEYGPRKNADLIKETDPLTPTSSYGYWKKALFQNGTKWSQVKNAEFIHLRPFNVFGPNCDPNMFLRNMIETLLSQQSFKMTKGEQYRSFVHVDVLVDTIKRLITLDTWKGLPQSLNVSEPHYFQLKALAEKVQKMIPNSHIEFGALNYRENETWHQMPDLTEIKKLLGPHFETNFGSQLKNLISFYQNQLK